MLARKVLTYIALACSTFYALETALVDQQLPRVPPLVLTFWSGLGITILSGCLLLFGQRGAVYAPSAQEWLLIALVTLLFFAADYTHFYVLHVRAGAVLLSTTYLLIPVITSLLEWRAPTLPLVLSWILGFLAMLLWLSRGRPRFFPLEAMPRASQHRLRREFERLQQTAKRVRLYDRPELYDLAYPGSPWDAAFYRRLAGPGSALYLGVGTGRVFAQIAGANQRLFGLDYSRAMLAAFAKRHPRLTSRVQHGNVLDQRLYQQARFDRILAPHSFFTQFGDDELMRALENCRRWLKPDGQFVTDNFSPFLNPPLSRRLELFRQRHTNEGDIVTYIEYEPVCQVVREWNFFLRRASRDVLVAPITLRYYYPAEFARILRAAGFEHVKLQGGFAGRSVSLESSELVYIARR